MTPNGQNVISARSAPRGASGITTFTICLVIFVGSYFFSTWLLTLYDAGDQIHYAEFWLDVSRSEPWQWRQLQIQNLGSYDIIYTYIIAFGAYFNIDRIIYLSLWNGILASSCAYLVIKYKGSATFGALLLTNYYVLVLFGSAERLKFAYLLLIIALGVNRIAPRLSFAIMSVFCHTQALLQFVSSAIYFGLSEYRQILRNVWNRVILIVALPLALTASIYYIYINVGDLLAQKSLFYSDQSQGISEIIQWTLILIVGTLVFDKRLQFFISMLPLGVLTFLYGNRINVTTLGLFCMLALVQRRTSHPLVLAVMAYMSFKSIGFMMNVLATGQGF